ncbi:hypothetical protein ACHAXR_013148 [Thalassiosira sp. AJA248-18]
MVSSSPYCFIAPLPHSSKSPSYRLSTPVYRHLPVSPPLLQLGASSPLDAFDVPLGAPLVVLIAAILAFSAQSWINSLLGGDQGLGAFLSDGGGFNRSGFKPRRRPISDERAVPGDTTKPLGGADPLPWLKLPEFDYVDVAGQPKKPKRMQQPLKPPSMTRDESEVMAKLLSLREQMKMEIERCNFEDAKRIESELEKIMKEEGYDYSA